MRWRVLLLALLGSLAATSCGVDEDGVVDVGATVRSQTVSNAATVGASRVAAAERVRDELMDAVTRARKLQSGLLMLRIQVTDGVLSDAAEKDAQESVLTACDGFPRDLSLDFWPSQFWEFYGPTGSACEGVQAVLKALDENAEANTVRALWRGVIAELTINSNFDIRLGQMLARLPSYTQTELLRQIQARQ
jgi:hypothetical protein